MKKLFLFPALILLFSAGFCAQPVKRDFSVALEVKNNGSVSVKEILTVKSDFKDKYSGLICAIPATKESPVQIEELYFNGRPLKYIEKKTQDSVELYFDGDIQIVGGYNIFNLRYNVKNAVKTHKDYKEIIWNAKQTIWVFPIRNIFFMALLPGDAIPVMSKVTALTGNENNDGKPAVLRTQELEFETQRPLAPGESLTITVPWETAIKNITK